MLLSQLVSAILNDLARAQDLANEYSSQLSRKYNKYESEKDNLLDNYQVPSGILHEIEFDLKFAIEKLSQNKSSSDLDIVGTYDKCKNFAKIIIDKSIEEIKGLIREIGVPQNLSGATVTPPAIPTLTPSGQSESSVSENNQEKTIQFWQKLNEQLEDKEYVQFYIKTLTEFIFDLGKKEYSRSKKWIIEDELKQIIDEALEVLVIENKDFNELLSATKQAFGKSDEDINKYKQYLKSKFEEVANKWSSSKEAKDMLVQISVIPNTDIIVNPSILKDIPVEMISSLKIKAGLQSYRWIIGETGQTLQKVKD